MLLCQKSIFGLRESFQSVRKPRIEEVLFLGNRISFHSRLQSSLNHEQEEMIFGQKSIISLKESSKSLLNHEYEEMIPLFENWLFYAEKPQSYKNEDVLLCKSWMFYVEKSPQRPLNNKERRLLDKKLTSSHAYQLCQSLLNPKHNALILSQKTTSNLPLSSHSTTNAEIKPHPNATLTPLSSPLNQYKINPHPNPSTENPSQTAIPATSPSSPARKSSGVVVSVARISIGSVLSSGRWSVGGLEKLLVDFGKSCPLDISDFD